jgi:hypothetical protein
MMAGVRELAQPLRKANPNARAMAIALTESEPSLLRKSDPVV